MIASGCTRFIACGGCGVLDTALAVGHLLVPHAAVRDEGTSYHYLPPSREVSASPLAVEAIVQTLTAHHVEHLVTKTWTTDAIFRETRERMQHRRDEGCLAVEMEAAAFFAVAQFRGVPFGQILYAGDDISGDVWDHRHWDKQASVREKLFWLAAEACLRLK
jgi:uridine phosphorylase